MPTKRLPCTCAHDHQDRTCGRGVRVHNKTAKKDPEVWRCTVCRSERTA